MTRVEVALAECDRLIALYDGRYGWAATYTAMLRIGRDVLTRHVDHADWPCIEAQPWLDLLAPEPTP